MDHHRLFRRPTRAACALLAPVLLFQLPAAGAATSMVSQLHGAACHSIDQDRAGATRTRRCPGVAGYRLLVHEAHAQTSVDIVTPQGQLYPLEYWEVVTPHLARVGRVAEWLLERRGGRLVPVGLLVRLDTAYPAGGGPRLAAGAILTAARIEPDGACVVYQGNGALRSADAAARAAVVARRKCLGVFRE